MLSFTYGGKNSYDDFGILISKRPPIPSPKRRVTNIEIPGRSSSLKFDENTFEDITLTVECSMKDGKVADKVDEIKSWLIGSGKGDLIFSFQQEKKYTAQVVNTIDFSQVFKYFSKFIIVFDCEPFKYAASNDTVTLTTAGKINNPGTIYSEPIIKLYGSGNITLKIGTQKIEMKGITDHIIIDSVLQNCYSATGENLNNKVLGELAKFDVGQNDVSWTGSVTKLEITPNWRWL